MAENPRDNTPEFLNPVEPLMREPDAVIENIYPLPGTPAGEAPRLDTASHDAFTTFAEDRMEPPVRRSGGVELVPYLTMVPRRRLGLGEWVITPRIAAAATIGMLVTTNLLGNLSNFASLGQEAWHNGKQAVEKLIHGQPNHKQVNITSTYVPGKTAATEVDVHFPVGSSVPDASDIRSIVNTVSMLEDNGDTNTTIVSKGDASTEWGPFANSADKKETGNGTLAVDRGAATAADLKAEGVQAGVELPAIAVSGSQDVLNHKQIQALEKLASKSHVSVDEAIAIYNHQPGLLTPALRKELDRDFGNRRSAHVTIKYQTPGSLEYHVASVPETPEKPYTPKDRDWELYWLPVVPPIRKGRINKTTELGINYFPRPLPKENERWVELYNEALQDDGETLVDGAWAWTRKYQLLAREDRIDYALTHAYSYTEKDKGGNEVEMAQEMRVLFIDHDPTDETIQMYKEMLTAFSGMRGGQIPKWLSTISVFPSSQVGTSDAEGEGGQGGKDGRHNAHAIGLGEDKQDERNTLGVAMPTIGLVEMHMPEDPTAEELYGLMGAACTLTHEVAGHGTDTREIAPTVRPIGPADARHFIARYPMADTAELIFDRLPDANARDGQEREFLVTREVRDRQGNMTTVKEKVFEGDIRLTEAVSVELLNRKPTSYAGESPAELYAETAALVVTNADVPYDKANAAAVIPRGPGFAQGYTVDPNLRDMFETRTGWTRKGSRPINEDEFTFMEAIDDPVIGRMIAHARNTPMPGPDGRFTILANADARSGYSQN